MASAASAYRNPSSSVVPVVTTPPMTAAPIKRPVLRKTVSSP
jgi:hypothetical protein